jgi:tRNA pseudouridine38-40 synthase
MRTIALRLAYDGTRYVGWQRQRTGVSIQGLIEDALLPLEGSPVTVTGAGRTDAGVHATGQVASFALAHPLSCESLLRAVNARLPDDVRVCDAFERPDGFNARFSAVAKTYRYAIFTGPNADPFDEPFTWHAWPSLDVPAMRAELGAVVGTHDFAGFQAAGSDTRSTIRTVTHASCEVIDAEPAWRPLAVPGPRLVVTLTGDGFLRHMVRNIVGTLAEVGWGRRPAGELARVLASGDRQLAGPTAPAKGLCLWHVAY